jgi:hypothetical protein
MSYNNITFFLFLRRLQSMISISASRVAASHGALKGEPAKCNYSKYQADYRARGDACTHTALSTAMTRVNIVYHKIERKQTRE